MGADSSCELAPTARRTAPARHRVPLLSSVDNVGVLTVVSSRGFAETLSRLVDAVARRGLTVFAQFDHAVAARDVELELAGEVVVVFGNPRTGTPLMQQDPRIGIELPLRMLVWIAGRRFRGSGFGWASAQWRYPAARC